ncbi:MAG: Reeler domain-containing protein [Planctomycetota bacterium]|nr:Reeler domain-containing protein [Planctomycetota bacterium]
MASNRPNYANCTQCHSGIVNSSNASLTLSGVPVVYTPGATYTITVSLTQSTAMRWGFEIVAQDPAGGQAGSFTVTDPNNTQLLLGAGSVEYVMHTDVGTKPGTPNGNSWTMDWTAPAAGFGKVVFAASGNAANDIFTTTGDKITNACVSSEEDDGSVPLALVAAQPNTIYAQRNFTWLVPVRVTNTQAFSQNLFVVARIKLPNGSYYPSTGWLYGPTAVSVNAGATKSVTISLPIPSGAPLVSPKLEVFVGTPAAGAMNQDTFVFTVVP